MCSFGHTVIDESCVSKPAAADLLVALAGSPELLGLLAPPASASVSLQPFPASGPSQPGTGSFPSATP